MSKNIKWGLAALATGACILAGSANAATITGSYNGMTWTAASTLVGVGPTGAGTVVIPPSATVRLGPGGASSYLPDPTKHSGTTALIMEYASGARFICSGSLMSDRRSIATAGHCVSGGDGVKDADLVKTTAFFWDYSTQGDERVALNPNAVAVDVTKYFVNPDYTGEVIDQNDIAVLRLQDYAPAFAQSYDLYDGDDLTGQTFNVAGYGNRSANGGTTGIAPIPSNGWLREGDNRYDFRLGDADFDVGGESIWRQVLGGTADYDFSYLSDFDDGTINHDTGCLSVVFGLGGPVTSKWCDGGLGFREVGVAGGDSGGPGFIDGKLASINSYGLSFGFDYGDVDDNLNSSFGEFSGYVPTHIHRAFIRAAMVPEPSTWALMIGGFGLAGGTLRRRRTATA